MKLRLTILLIGAPWAFPPGGVAAPQVQFNRDVLPILSDKCFRCHGPDTAAREADLRLDREQDAKREREGRFAIAPRGAGESELLKRIASSDDSLRMPPPESLKQLTRGEVATLQQWVREGAPWETHWAFQPVRRPPADSATAIDDWVAQRRAAAGLAPAPRAAPSVLLRRLSLDLTGLPPTPEQTRRFASDPSPERYRAEVDRLLSDPSFGEHQAWRWLEAARYADTHGYQKDNVRTMWAWRDWVVRAFNDNMPFDQFTIEQIAGDLLPDASIAQRVASGFNRNHRINAEAGSIDEEFRVEYVADRVDTTATVWLGLTVGCARCHDHKFDPISQREYYSLFAFFNQVAERGSDGVGAAPAPFLEVPVPGYAGRIAAAQRAVEDCERQLNEALAQSPEALAEWRAAATAAVRRREAWAALPGDDVAGQDAGTTFTVLPDQSILVGGANLLNDTHTVRTEFNRPAEVQSLQVEALTHSTLAGGRLARSFDGNFLLSEVELLCNGQPIPLTVAETEANRSEPGLAAGPARGLARGLAAAIDGDPLTGWSVSGERLGENQRAIFVIEPRRAVRAGDVLEVRLRYESREEQFIIGRFRLSVAESKPPPQDRWMRLPLRVAEAMVEGEANVDRAPADKALAGQALAGQALADRTVAAHFRETSPRLASLRRQRDRSRAALLRWRRASVTQAMVMNDAAPRTTHVLIRGEYDRRGDAVTPNVPAALGGPLPEAGALGEPARLQFARWLAAPENPLTARVMVNRIWQGLLGAGLVRTAEDFGSQGERPSHPELLDWLAAEFVASGWDVKHLIRLIVTSETYQQSSRATREQWERDPENRWLARGPRQRLPAAVIRDQALFVSGQLSPRIGGPPVRPYQPPGLWEAVAGVNSNTTRYRVGTGEALRRRSLYTFWKRSVPPPNMTLLDAANRDACSVTPQTTNSPLQALVLLNDPTFDTAARALAARALKNRPDDPNRALQEMWRRTQSAPLTASTRRLLMEAFRAASADYQRDLPAAAQRVAAGPDAAAQEDAAAPAGDRPADRVMWAALTDVAAILLNLDSTLSKE